MMTEFRDRPQVLTEGQIIEVLQELKKSKTQQEIVAFEQRIKKIIMFDKNFSTMVTMVLSKDIQLDYKIAILSTFNLIVQEFLRRYENIQNKSKSKKSHKKIDELRKEIINVSTKMQKIIDSNIVPMHLKLNIVLLHIKLANRSKQDWDSSRMVTRMEYYFRKDHTALAIAYFTNIVKLGFSIRERIQIIKKVILHLPNSTAKCLTKIIRGENKDKAIYEDFTCVLGQMVNIIKNVYKQISNEIVLNWCNSQIFMAMVKALAEEVTRNNSIINSLKQWQSMLIELLRGMTENINYHKLMVECHNFLDFYNNFIVHIWQSRYLACPDDHPDKFQACFGDYLPLFINAIKMKVLPRQFTSPKREGVINLDGSYVESLDLQEKIFIMKNYVMKVQSYFNYKISKFLTTESKQTLTQTLQLFSQLCSSKEQDPESQNFPYNLSLFLLQLTRSYNNINYFLKNLIQSLFLSHDKENMGSQWWLKQEYMLIEELNRGYQDRLDIGVLLCLLMYRNVVLDRNYVEQCVGGLIWHVVGQADNPEIGILSMSNHSIMLFLLLLQNYMEQIPIYTTANSRIKQYKLSPFIKSLVSHLSTRTSSLHNLQAVILTTIKKYIQLTKCIINQYKQSATYQAYCKNIQFRELQVPLQEFHGLLHSIPVGYYAELYGDIIGFQMFGIQGESQAETIDRVKIVIDGILRHEDLNPQSLVSTHNIFRIFVRISQCSEYIPLMADLFAWVYRFATSSSQTLLEYEEDLVDLCLAVLKKPQVVAGMGGQTLGVLWELVFLVLDVYEWKEYTTQAEITYLNSNQRCCYISETSFTAKQLLLFYLSSCYNTPDELTTLIFKKATRTLLEIIKLLTDKKRNLLIAKYRPYQIEEIAFLLAIHKIVETHAQDLSSSLPIIEELLALFWASFEFRHEFPDDFNYVNGKYNLIVILLMRHCWPGFSAVLQAKGQEIAQKIYFEVFYNDNSYRVEYDCSLFVVSTVELMKRLWQPKKELDRHLLKYAHFAIGGCILCLDRIYQNFRKNRDEGLEVQGFKRQIKNPILETQIQMAKFVKFLTAGEPYIDEFHSFQQFYNSFRDNDDVFDWFYNAMSLYVKNQVNLDYFYTVLAIKKIQKPNGLVIYRICKYVQEKFKQNQ